MEPILILKYILIGIVTFVAIRYIPTTTLLQEDIFNDKYNLKTELLNNIEKIKTDIIIQNIYMCKNNEYQHFN